MRIKPVFLALFPILAWSSPPDDDCRLLYDAGQYAQAFPVCLAAAEAGDVAAKSIVGECYDRGLGVASDPAQASRWWRDAAAGGSLEAQNLLAMKYYYGGSVFGPEAGWRQDYPQAMRLWRISAEQANPASQFMLAEMYRLGLGVSADPVEAYAWYLLASTGGYALATDGAMQLRRQLTPNQQQAARQKYRDYRRRFGKK